ncbi:MAG TPA: pyruvate kinase [Rhodospirillales bacterium]|nr:pyruvate kinase [Rhodospirillales bacterium]
MERNDPKTLLSEMREVRRHVVDEGEALLARWQPMIRREAFGASARNLAHYLAFRQLDLRPLQAALAPWGLASLSRKEGRVLPSLNSIIANLEVFSRSNEETERPSVEDFQRGTEALAENTAAIFGPALGDRRTRILVTLSRRAGKDLDFVRGLVRAGMDAARVNCAHDGPDVWSAMIANVRQAAGEADRACPVLMDLQGPKIRTQTVLARKDRNVQPGDRILLTFGEPEEDEDYAFQASCATPSVFRQVGNGATVSIKDGLIRGRVEAVEPEGLVVEVTRTPPGGQAFVEEKGINFPDTELDVLPLTDPDLDALDFVAVNADIVGYSFVQRPEDVALLQRELDKRRPGLPPMPIVAKIETKLAFANLPELIVQAAGANPFAVMIARGDLAVEIGYERLSEIQEEILWLCEAAHVPVIWATQVLESLVKRGMPSRGEFTDAAMAERAECVMLNKGRYIEEGITVLDNVLRRMETHRIKRSAQLRPLAAWDAVI